MKKQRKRRKRKAVSALDLTNLIDVIFALLIIFMITAPMMTQGVHVDLPKATSENVEVTEDVIQISITKRGEIYINDIPVSLDRFSGEFLKVFKKPDTPVYVNADDNVRYGIVAKILSQLQQIGVEKLGFLTEPIKEK